MMPVARFFGGLPIRRRCLAHRVFSFGPIRHCTDDLGHHRADRHPGEHVARIVHAKHQARQRHRRHQDHRQRQPGRPAQQNRRRRRRRGVRRREAQPARRADVHGDRGWSGAFAFHDPLDHHGGGVRQERPCPGHRARRRLRLAAAARRAARRRPIRRCVHRSGTGPARPSTLPDGPRASTARRRAPRPHRAAHRRREVHLSRFVEPSRASSSTISHFCLLDSTGSASRYTRRMRLNLRASSTWRSERLPQQFEHLRAVTLPVDDAATVGGGHRDAVDLAQENHRASCVATLICGAVVVLGVLLLQLVEDATHQPHRDGQRDGGGSAPSCATACRTASAARSHSAAPRRRGTPRASCAPRAARTPGSRRCARARPGSRPSPCSGWRPSNTQGTEGV